MNPEIWGPKLWFFIHTLAINYPDNPTQKDKNHYSKFFENLKYIIPCEKCRINYIDSVNKNPVKNHLKDSTTLFRWTVDLHNKVNSEIGKPILSYEEATKELSKQYSNSNSNTNNHKFVSSNITNLKNIEYFEDTPKIQYMKIFKYLLLIILLICIILYALKFKNII